jgi:D-glucuronyl C5-epimerase C-terminus
MRHLTPALAALAATLACSVASAEAAPVLDVTPHGVRVENEPALDGPWSQAGPLPSARATGSAAPPAVRLAAKRDLVKQTIDRAFARKAIDAPTRARYLASWAAARGTLRGLSGQRQIELDYVVATLQRLAAGKRLAARLEPMFTILDRNREWWAKAGPPASGARLRFGASRMIFQYFPGEGLQFHPLANFGQANGYWLGHRDADLRSLVEDLLKMRVDRGGFVTWEYYFAFGGGSPPWISGMAQGTAMQALSRASKRLTDPALLEVARRAQGAFQVRTPVGVHAPQGNRDWYALYSFAPRLNVLNGMLQAVSGLFTYQQFSNDTEGKRLFDAGDRTARAVIDSYDTGAWSLYDRPGGSPGHEASLNYHTLNRDFSQTLCKVTGAPVYCTAADRFTRYLKEDPRLDPFSAVPSPARSGKGVRFKFRLSKVGRVGIVVKDAASGRTYLSTSASFEHGDHYFRWVPPQRAGEHTYDYALYARDLAGNSASVKDQVRVRGGRPGKPGAGA